MNLKAFARNENPILADKNQTLTTIEQKMRKQGGGGALKRAAASFVVAWKARLCQRLIFICGYGGSPFELRLCDSFLKHLAFDLLLHVLVVFLSCSLAYPTQPISDHQPTTIRPQTTTIRPQTTTDDHYLTTNNHDFKVLWKIIGNHRNS